MVERASNVQKPVEQSVATRQVPARRVSCAVKNRLRLGRRGTPQWLQKRPAAIRLTQRTRPAVIAAIIRASSFSVHTRARGMGWLATKQSVRCWNLAPKESAAAIAMLPKKTKLLRPKKNGAAPPSACSASGKSTAIRQAAIAATEQGGSN